MCSNDFEFASSSEEDDSDYEEGLLSKISFCSRSQFRKSPESVCSQQSRYDYDPTGRDTYTKACRLLKITPAQHFLRSITQQEVDLSHRGLGPLGARAVSIALLKNTFITKINLKDNGFGEEGMKCICVVFEQNYFISDLDVGDNHCNVKGAEYLAKMLSFCNTLKRLDVSGNDIGNHGMELIAEALGLNYSLEKLCLSHNNISGIGAKSLQNALDGNITLKELNLSWNNLSYAGTKELVKALTSNTSLQALDLSWNGLADSGAKLLLNALKENSSLTYLNLASNRISDLGAEALIPSIPVNETLQTLDLTMNPITKPMLLKIVSARLGVETSKLTTLIFRDKTLANDEDIANIFHKPVPTNECFNLELGHIRVKDDPRVKKWKEMHKEDLCERFLAFVRGRRIRMMDLFQKFGASGDLVLSVNKFSQGMEKLKKEMRMSDWEIHDLANYLRSKDGQIHCSYLTSL